MASYSTDGIECSLLYPLGLCMGLSVHSGSVVQVVIELFGECILTQKLIRRNMSKHDFNLLL